MSQIDKKYKEEFGEQNFPDSLKKKGWADMEKMLDAEMPVSGSGSGLWRALGLALLVLLLIPAIWYWGFRENQAADENIQPNPTEINIADEEQPDLLKQESEEITSGEPQNEEGEIPTSSGKVDVEEDSPLEVVAENYAPTSITNNRKSSSAPAGTKPSGSSVNSSNPVNVESESENSADESTLMAEADIAEEKGDIKEPSSPSASVNEQEKEPVALENQEESPGEPKEETLNQPSEMGTTETPESEEEEKTTNFRMAHLAFPNIAEADVLSSAGEEDKMGLFSRERFSVSLWGGYAFTGKLLESENTSYLEKRKAEEKEIWTIPTGVNLDYFLNSNWTLGLGIRWAEYGEELQYNFNRRDTAVVDGRYGSVNDYNNVVSVDSMRVITGIFQGYWNYNVVYDYRDTTLEKNNGRTSWNYVEIPLTLGYRFGKGRLKPWLRGGFSLGVPIQTSFRYIQAGSNLSLSEEETSGLVAPLQYNALFSLGVDCYLSRSISLRLNGFGNMQLNSSLVQDGVRQRYYQLGISLEAAYNF